MFTNRKIFFIHCVWIIYNLLLLHFNAFLGYNKCFGVWGTVAVNAVPELIFNVLKKVLMNVLKYFLSIYVLSNVLTLFQTPSPSCPTAAHNTKPLSHIWPILRTNTCYWSIILLYVVTTMWSYSYYELLWVDTALVLTLGLLIASDTGRACRRQLLSTIMLKHLTDWAEGLIGIEDDDVTKKKNSFKLYAANLSVIGNMAPQEADSNRPQCVYISDHTFYESSRSIFS